jgi:transcriptional regulator with XRE-family HTH domain
LSEIVLLHDPEKLRRWRDESGLSREQVCSRITEQGEVTLSFPWLAALEGGYNHRQPSVPLLAALARFYGHEPGELLATAAEGTPA